MPSFKFRRASMAQTDDRFFVEAWDSAFLYLAGIGSEKQWAQLPSTQPASVQRVRKLIEDSDVSFDRYPEGSTAWGPDWCRAYTAEVEIKSSEIPESLRYKYNGKANDIFAIPVGAMVLTSKSSDYVRPVIPEQDPENPFIFLKFLMTDHRAGPLAKGAGAALLDLAKGEVLKLGLKRLCGDCWRGNRRKLVEYYEGQGLKPIGNFDVPRDDAEPWPGTVTEWKSS